MYKLDREARRAHLEHLIRTERCATARTFAARQLGKLWAEEALDDLRKALAAC